MFSFYSNRLFRRYRVTQFRPLDIERRGCSLILTFNATIDMKRPNGSEMHSHKVNNLVITMAVIHENHSEVIQGRTLITMQGGFVSDVPTTLNLTRNNISPYFNPIKIENHFDNQSMGGSISK